ncbi:MAG: DUF11 domain-containing protein, partial [Anaerolineales bacterium]|nr:DUF11 domain-containing protein [Anaerolineales bacterium]
MIDDAVVSLQVLDQPRSGWRTGFWRGVVLLLAALVTGIALALSPALIHPPAPRTTAPVHTLSADKLLPAPPLARSMPFLPLAAEPVLGSSAAFALDPNILWGQNTAPQTQIAASNSAEQSYVRLSGAASSNLSPGSLLDLPLLNLPDPETAPVPASLPGDPPLALEDPQAGIFSISGSFAAFDPSGGGSSCYQPGITQTLCFDAEAYTTDGEWPTILTLLFPTGWQVSNVTDVGPHQCDNGGSIDPDMEWITYTLSNEIIISQTFMLTSPVDHCSTTYCVDVTMVDVGPSARVSWYWFVGSPVGASPHYVCSSDGYTPFGAPACEESLLPSASIASCAAAGADLAVDKTGPATVTAGDLLTYTITVHNNGPLDALNVVLTDTLPYGILPLSPLTYTLGDIAAGDAITVEVVAQSDPNACYEGKVNNFVEVASDTPDLDPTNNNDEWGTIILSQASLTIAKLSSPDPATAGGLVDFTLTITNTGPGCASDVIVIDELGYTSNPPDLVMEDYSTLSTQGSGPLAGYWYSCSSGGACQRAEPMPSGTVDTITLTLRIPADSQPGAYINFADVIWDSGSDNTPTFWNVIAEADLSIAKGVIKDEICLGSYGFYELVVTNGGPSDAQNVVVSDTLPAELLFGGGSPECSEAAGVVTCNAGTLAAGASADFLIAFNITPTVIGGTIITNTASVSSATSDPSPLSNTSNPATFTAVQCSLPEADMAIIKTVDPINVVAGEELTFTLTITNNGPHAAEDVTVQDLFLQPLEIVSLAIDPLVWSCDGGLSCIRQEAMPSGASETITLVVRLPSDVIPGDYTNTAFVNAANPDPDTSDNWAEAPYAVTAQPVLSIAKTALAAEMIAGGDPVQYSILVTNDGPSD